MEADREGLSPACCQPTDRIARHFDANVGDLVATGRASELSDVSNGLLRLLLAAGPSGKTVLELGSGRGGLLLRLAEAGASRVTGVDLSAASLDFARRRFQEAGLADRGRFELGNAALAALEAHDWVILDRALCCYPDLDRFLSNSVPAARLLYAFSVPESRGLRGGMARVSWSVENVVDRFRRDACPGFVHDLDRIASGLGSAGFRRTAHEPLRLWNLAVYERTAG